MTYRGFFLVTQFLVPEALELLSIAIQEIEFSTSVRVWRKRQVLWGPVYGWMGRLGGALCQPLATQMPGAGYAGA